jgi:CRP-like cAMP-binding protein
MPAEDSPVPERRELVSPLARMLQLKRIPMLAGLPSSEVAFVADAAEERFFPRGATVLREGQPASAVYFVVDGALSVLRRGRPMGRVGPGASVGGLPVLARSAHGVEATAEEDTLTLEIDADVVGEILEDRFPILLHILRETSRRLIELTVAHRLDPAAWTVPRSDDPSGGRDLDLVDRIFFLRRMRVFERSSINALAQLARAMAQIRFEPGTLLWREGEAARGIFLLLAGRVRATSARGLEFRPGPGFALGALEALGESSRFYDAVVETPLVALQGDMEVLVDVFEDHVDMALDYLAVVARSTMRILGQVAAGEIALLDRL